MPKLQRSYGGCKISAKVCNGRTVLGDLRQEGASRAMFPSPDGSGWLEAVLVNTSGGTAGGDRFEVDFEGGPNTKVVVTTQACERYYRSLGEQAHLDIRLSVGPAASLVWCPQETILFDEARVSRTLFIDMAADASLIVLEPILFGRTASNETFRSGAITDQWRIRVDGRLVHAEALRIEASIDQPISRPAVLGKNAAVATLLLINPPPAIGRNAISRLNQATRNSHVAASYWKVASVPKLVIRALAVDGYSLRSAIDQIISCLNLERPLPRVWRV